MQGRSVAACRCRQRQLALHHGQTRLVDASLLRQGITLKRMHADDFAECPLVGLTARRAPGRSETRWTRDVLTTSEALLELCLALQALGPSPIVALAQCCGALAHHGRAHQRLLALGVSHRPSIRAARGTSSGLVARTRAPISEAVASIAQPEGASRS
jgi:hypothetical protein